MANETTATNAGYLASMDARKKRTFMALALGFITFALFAPAIRFEFITYDDDLYVYTNPQVLAGLSGAGLKYAFTTVDVGNWMPLTWLSFQLDATLYGAWPAGFHFTNIALHCASVILIFLALERMTKSFWPSALVAALFAFHPLRQESVIWIAERKGALSTFFWALGLMAYARYAERRSIGRYVAVAVCLALGLMAKSMLVTFPAALLLLDFWPLKRMGEPWAEMRAKVWPLVLEKLPLLLVCGVMVGITYYTQKNAGAIGASVAAQDKPAQALNSYLFYLQKIVWPANLAIPYPPQASSTAQTVIALLVIGVTTIAAFFFARRSPWFTVGWLWFLGTFIPVIGLIQISHTFVADRYTYVPFIGIAMIVAWGVASLAERSTMRNPALLIGLGLCVATALANSSTLTRWANSIALFSDSVSKAPHHVSCNNLASALNNVGDFTNALRVADLGVRLNSNSADVLCTRGLTKQGLGQFNDAIEDYSASLKLKPNLARTWNNRGNAYASSGNLDAALADVSHAIELKPDFTEAWNNRAFIWFSKSNYPAALADCTRAIEINPGSSRAYNNRGNVYSGMGDQQHAAEDYSRCIALDPTFTTAYNNRAAAFLALKEYDKARMDLQMCQKLGGEPNAKTAAALAPVGAPK